VHGAGILFIEVVRFRCDLLVDPAIEVFFDDYGDGFLFLVAQLDLDVFSYRLVRRVDAEIDLAAFADDIECRANSDVNVMRRPADGRLFLLSNQLPDKLITHYQIWNWMHVAIFCDATGTAFALF